MLKRFSLICKLEVIDNAAAWVQQRAAIASHRWKQESWSCSEAVPPVLAPCSPQLLSLQGRALGMPALPAALQSEQLECIWSDLKVLCCKIDH